MRFAHSLLTPIIHLFITSEEIQQVPHLFIAIIKVLIIVIEMIPSSFMCIFQQMNGIDSMLVPLYTQTMQELIQPRRLYSALELTTSSNTTSNNNNNNINNNQRKKMAQKASSRTPHTTSTTTTDTNNNSGNIFSSTATRSQQPHTDNNNNNNNKSSASLLRKRKEYANHDIEWENDEMILLILQWIEIFIIKVGKLCSRHHIMIFTTELMKVYQILLKGILLPQYHDRKFRRIYAERIRYSASLQMQILRIGQAMLSMNSSYQVGEGNLLYILQQVCIVCLNTHHMLASSNNNNNNNHYTCEIHKILFSIGQLLHPSRLILPTIAPHILAKDFQQQINRNHQQQQQQQQQQLYDDTLEGQGQEQDGELEQEEHQVEDKEEGNEEDSQRKKSRRIAEDQLTGDHDNNNNNNIIVENNQEENATRVRPPTVSSSTSSSSSSSFNFHTKSSIPAFASLKASSSITTASAAATSSTMNISAVGTSRSDLFNQQQPTQPIKKTVNNNHENDDDMDIPDIDISSDHEN
jgi:hypothetical protein